MVLGILATILSLMLMSGCTVNAAEGDTVAARDLAQGFVHPPDATKPWVYWYWISDNISREGITRDLEAMARVGIGEAFIGNIGLDDIPYGKVPVLSEEWWGLVEHAIREGKRVGVNIGMFNCPGWSQSGGPWVKSTEAMRYLVSTETRVSGGKPVVLKLSRATERFQDVRVLAFPLPPSDAMTLTLRRPRISTSPVLKDAQRSIDGDRKSVCTFAGAGDSKSVTIDLVTGAPFTARALTLVPGEKPWAADCALQIADHDSFRTVKEFLFDRSNMSVSVGPMPLGNVTVSFPGVTARHFRLVLSNFAGRSGRKAADASLAEIELTAAPRLERYVEKQLGKMHQTPFPLWTEYQWAVQQEADDRSLYVDPAGVLDISQDLVGGDTLRWDAPAGEWLVMRLGASPTGTENSPSVPHGRGPEVDKMSREHLQKHFDAFIGELLRRMPAEERTAFTHVVLDSYEQGSENWTEGLTEDFQERYGYDPVPWLPVLTGRVVGSAERSDRFLWDLRRLVADRVAYDYVGGLRDMSAEHGLRVWLENYGHWGFPSEFLMYGGQSHDIGGEFWNEGELGNIECRAASSAAHIYGMRRVSAESYTAAGLPFRRYPALLKKRGDWSYTEGINHVVLHVCISQPYEERNPGVNAWFGTEFNRKNTWFEQSRKWIDYQRRCMFMLQRGLPVNDVCYFIGEDAPKMTGIRVPELPPGYSFDYINAEVILQRLAVKDGRLILPDGMSYGMMVLPPVKTMRPEVLAKIASLVEDGAVILGAPVDGAPGLKDYPRSDLEVRSIASKLWNGVGGAAPAAGTYGKGRVFNTQDMRLALDQAGIQPDLVFPDSTPVVWTHRRLGTCDIYFVSNQSDRLLQVDLGFRVSGKQPELWDAVTGMIRDLPVFTGGEGRTNVLMELDPYGSAFVIFNRMNTAQHDPQAVNFPALKTVARVDGPWTIRFEADRGGPADPVFMPVLTDWAQSRDARIRYYSGSATYTTRVVLPARDTREMLYLDLGSVGVMAEVRVNGKAAGGVWTPPWRVSIGDLAREGENTIEIEVVNTWANRLIGDSKLPVKDRRTWVAVPAAQPSDALMPSGLLGPVTIRSSRP
ncbi:MAG: glycoside hydrolase family 2 [Ignavibacteriae bacterium]|nr:glycoside hydrolase family 2 [Ignavibacteriota bacterium]